MNVVVVFRYPRPPHRIGEFAFPAASAPRRGVFSTCGHTCALVLANASATSRKTYRNSRSTHLWKRPRELPDGHFLGFRWPSRQPRSRQTFPNRVLRERDLAPFHRTRALRANHYVDCEHMPKQPRPRLASCVTHVRFLEQFPKEWKLHRVCRSILIRWNVRPCRRDHLLA